MFPLGHSKKITSARHTSQVRRVGGMFAGKASVRHPAAAVLFFTEFRDISYTSLMSDYRLIQKQRLFT